MSSYDNNINPSNNINNVNQMDGAEEAHSPERANESTCDKIKRLAPAILIGIACVALIVAGAAAIVFSFPIPIFLAGLAIAVGAVGLIALGIVEYVKYKKSQEKAHEEQSLPQSQPTEQPISNNNEALDIMAQQEADRNRETFERNCAEASSNVNTALHSGDRTAIQSKIAAGEKLLDENNQHSKLESAGALCQTLNYAKRVDDKLNAVDSMMKQIETSPTMESIKHLEGFKNDQDLKHVRNGIPEFCAQYRTHLANYEQANTLCSHAIGFLNTMETAETTYKYNLFNASMLDMCKQISDIEKTLPNGLKGKLKEMNVMLTAKKTIANRHFETLRSNEESMAQKKKREKEAEEATAEVQRRATEEANRRAAEEAAERQRQMELEKAKLSVPIPSPLNISSPTASTISSPIPDTGRGSRSGSGSDGDVSGSDATPKEQISPRILNFVKSSEEHRSKINTPPPSMPVIDENATLSAPEAPLFVPDAPAMNSNEPTAPTAPPAPGSPRTDSSLSPSGGSSSDSDSAAAKPRKVQPRPAGTGMSTDLLSAIRNGRSLNKVETQKKVIVINTVANPKLRDMVAGDDDDDNDDFDVGPISSEPKESEKNQKVSHHVSAFTKPKTRSARADKVAAAIRANKAGPAVDQGDFLASIRKGTALKKASSGDSSPSGSPSKATGLGGIISRINARSGSSGSDSEGEVSDEWNS